MDEKFFLLIQDFNKRGGAVYPCCYHTEKEEYDLPKRIYGITFKNLQKKLTQSLRPNKFHIRNAKP